MSVRLLLVIILLVSGFTCGFAQESGQTLADVRRAHGEPMMSRKTGDTETWIYSDGTKVVFRNGVVAGAPKATNLTVDREEDETDNVTVVAAPAPAPVAAPASAAPRAALAGSSREAIAPTEDMSPVMVAFFVVCVAAVVVGSIWFHIMAFKESVWWGLGCLFVPVVSLFFLIGHWHEAKKPFLLYLLGAGAAVLVAIIGAA